METELGGVLNVFVFSLSHQDPGSAFFLNVLKLVDARIIHPQPSVQHQRLI